MKLLQISKDEQTCQKELQMAKNKQISNAKTNNFFTYLCWIKKR